MERKQYNTLILVLGSLSAIGPFSIDMYLPGFPAIAADLKTDIAHVGLSLTTYFIGISIGQIFYGPIMDRYGRKKPMMLGLLLYIAAALGCAFSSSIEALIILRLFLALGAGVGITGSRAVVRDFFSGNEIARVLSLLVLVFGIAPIIAPTIGGMMVAAFGWRSIFLVLAVIAILVLFAVIRYLRESKGPDITFSLRPKNILLEYLNVSKNRAFVTYGLASSAVTAGFFSYITGSPFLYIKLFGFTERQFGWIYGVNVFGLIVASQLNRLWLRRHSSGKVLFLATVAQFCIAIALLIGIQQEFWVKTAAMGLIFCYLFFIGVISPNSMALVLQPFTRNAGSAAALVGCLQMVVAASASGLVSYLHNGTAVPMVSMMAGCTAVSLLILCESVLFTRRQLAAPQR